MQQKHISCNSSETILYSNIWLHNSFNPDLYVDFLIQYEDRHLPVYIVDVRLDNNQVACNHHCQDVSCVPAEKDTHYQKMYTFTITLLYMK